MTSTVAFGADELWNQFRSSALWRSLRKVALLRSGLYLAIELRRTLREPHTTTREIVDKDFTTRKDPWKYETNPLERARFSDQTDMLDEVREGRLFAAGLEIGCAEGVYTEVMAERCESLLVLDLSPTALVRAQSRREWPERVRFDAFDLRRDPIPGTYDVIVLTGVLEYFNRPKTLFQIREKLAAALRHKGYLLIETTRANPVVEDSWWGQRLIRGKWINVFMSRHPSLAVIESTNTESYCITLCRKTESGNTP